MKNEKEKWINRNWRACDKVDVWMRIEWKRKIMGIVYNENEEAGKQAVGQEKNKIIHEKPYSSRI